MNFQKERERLQQKLVLKKLQQRQYWLRKRVEKFENELDLIHKEIIKD